MKERGQLGTVWELAVNLHPLHQLLRFPQTACGPAVMEAITDPIAAT